MTTFGADHSVRLAALARSIEQALGKAVSVERSDSPVKGVEFNPRNPAALRIGWVEFDVEVVLSTPGGRWELGVSAEDMDFLEAVVRSVIQGRVCEVRTLGRSPVTVVLDDGRSVRTTTAQAPEGCLPLPWWTSWGRKTSFEPYSP